MYLLCCIFVLLEMLFREIFVCASNGKVLSGRKIAPNTGANATKFFSLVTKS